MNSVTSCWMNLKFGLPPRCAILSTAPVTKLSIAMTLCPRASSRSVKWEPRKPAAPVTTLVNWEEIGFDFMSSADCQPIPQRSVGGMERWSAAGKGVRFDLAALHHSITPPLPHLSLHSYFAPVPASTMGTVRQRILKSSHSDQLSIYSKSNRTQSLKSVTLFRPLICQRQVKPGLTLKRRR